MDEKYMLRAIELALKGKGAVNPNPLVGAVIVKDNRIIGEGYHRKYGELHAERDAFKNLTESAEGADMYVTLEPCSHHGKQPPCTEAIVSHGIKNVYVGSFDPNPLVSGKGFKFLRDHGVNAYTDILKDKCDEINKVFFHYITTKTPYVVMKYAMTMDGKIACHTGESKWVTSETARNNVQLLRSELTGIMVGINTVLKDNPRLTSRIAKEDEGKVIHRDPVRIVCDTNLRIPLDSELVNTAKDIKTIVAYAANENSDKVSDTISGTELSEKIKLLEEKNVILINCFNPKSSRVDLKLLMSKLGEMGIDSILLEGGGTLNYEMLKANLVSHVKAYIAPKMFGGATSPSPVMGEGVKTPDEAYILTNKKISLLGDDILIDYDIKKCD
ncbi:MAG: bifunctional diaminohydroxyphosphoribosylaminopyrimidine deaminase/5-amino-6-(5-phosphoribosylamino)uracil reductase RibD [Lachnospiraceae bacterium]|nr:bifunctional diaminohydroxyphosphoribosylaminopyrimidine deaminase/5-amino-6-(5-phosphoribosylamino)uracil reductase RibD [Lachnospiraceae bacterium]